MDYITTLPTKMTFTCQTKSYAFASSEAYELRQCGFFLRDEVPIKMHTTQVTINTPIVW